MQQILVLKVVGDVSVAVCLYVHHSALMQTTARVIGLCKPLLE